MTMRTLRERRLGQMIVCPACAGAALRMASLWIRHGTTPYSVNVEQTFNERMIWRDLHDTAPIEIFDSRPHTTPLKSRTLP
jgi:hypothetical protein